MKAATYALNRDCSVVICNGCEENAIVNIVKGKKVGTFFTKAKARGTPVELQAYQGLFYFSIFSVQFIVVSVI